MPTIQQIIYDFLTFEGINQAWIARELYPNQPLSARGKLHAKLYGDDGRSFTDEELTRLMAIRKDFITRLL